MHLMQTCEQVLTHFEMQYLIVPHLLMGGLARVSIWIELSFSVSAHYIIPSSTETLSKVKATSCCKAAAAVFDTTAVLLA